MFKTKKHKLITTLSLVLTFTLLFGSIGVYASEDDSPTPYITLHEEVFPMSSTTSKTFTLKVQPYGDIYV